MSEGREMKIALSKVLNFMKKEGLVPDLSIRLKIIDGDINQYTLAAYLHQVVINNKDVITLDRYKAVSNKLPKYQVYMLLRNEAIQLKCRYRGLLLEVPCYGAPMHRWGDVLHSFVIKSK